MKLNKKRYLVLAIVWIVTSLAVDVPLNLYVFHWSTKALIIASILDVITISLIWLGVYVYDKKNGPQDKRFIAEDAQ